VRHLIRELADDGASVLVSSHLLSEIDQVCTHVGVMSRGRLLVQGERDAVTSGGRRSGDRAVVTTLREHADGAGRVLAQLARVDPASASVSASVEDADHLGAVTVTAALGAASLADVAPALVAAGVPVLGIRTDRPSLEDVFVELTGEGFDVAR
jgi:ABC-2 type transport system ATP-binding protein